MKYTQLMLAAAGMGLLGVAALDAQAAVKKGETLPAFQLQGVQGEAVSNTAFSGSAPGIVYLFKTEKCDPCLDGLKELKEVSGQPGSDLRIIGIGKEDNAAIGQAAKSAGVSFPMASGDKEVFQNLNASLLPTTLVVGPEGKVMKVIQGGGQHAGDLLNAVAETQLQRKDAGGAQKLYLRANKSGGKVSVVAQAGMGYSQLQEGKVTDAESSFKHMASSQDSALALQGKEGLAEVLLRQGKTDEALKLADEVLQVDPKRTMANLVRGKALSMQGHTPEAQKALVVATADDAGSDFAWQKAEAHLAMGNITMQGKESQIALKSYRRAADENPYFAEALSNEGVALKEMGEPEKAMEVFQKLQKIDPGDKLVHALLRQAQAAIAQKQDLERRQYINGLVQDLVKQFKENQAKPKAQPEDDWTSPVMAISILGFQSNANGMLMGRIGLEGLLQDELTRELQQLNIKVVDRAILDQLLEELKLGSSELADPDTALKLGRIMAARLISTGSFMSAGNGGVVSMRLVDTETTNIVLSLAEKEVGVMDPTAVAPKFAHAIHKSMTEQYPLKGRIAMAEGETIIINLGKKHGVSAGQKFNVVGDGQPIELNGRILGYKPAKLGSLEVTQVEDLMAYAKVVDKSGEWAKNQKIIVKQ